MLHTIGCQVKAGQGFFFGFFVHKGTGYFCLLFTGGSPKVFLFFLCSQTCTQSPFQCEWRSNSSPPIPPSAKWIQRLMWCPIYLILMKTYLINIFHITREYWTAFLCSFVINLEYIPPFHISAFFFCISAKSNICPLLCLNPQVRDWPEISENLWSFERSHLPSVSCSLFNTSSALMLLLWVS